MMSPAKATIDRRTKRAPKAPAPMVLEAGPPALTVVLPVEAIEADNLGIGELLDLAEVMGTDLPGVAAMMASKGLTQARILVGYAWILARRKDPAITWAEAQRWRIEVNAAPRPPDPNGAKPPSGARLGSED